MNTAQRIKHDVQRAVKRLVKAEIANSWKGGGDPENIPAIEHELNEARAQYRNTLARIGPAFSVAITAAKASA